MKVESTATLRHDIGAAITGIYAFDHQIIVDLLHATGSAQNVEDVILLTGGFRFAHDVYVIVDRSYEIIQRVSVLRTKQAGLDLGGDPGVLGLLASGIRSTDKEFVKHFPYTLSAADNVENFLAFSIAGHDTGKEDVAIKDVDADIGEVGKLGLTECILDADLDFGIGGDLLGGSVLQADVTGTGSGTQHHGSGTTREQRQQQGTGHEERSGTQAHGRDFLTIGRDGLQDELDGSGWGENVNGCKVGVAVGKRAIGERRERPQGEVYAGDNAH